jgi:quinol monooxygenase YgiN
MIIIHAHFEVKADKEQAFLEEIKPLVTASQAEDGNISYELMKNSAKELAYSMIELWKDVEAVEFHNKSAHFIAFGKKAPEFMAAPVDVQVFNGEKLER